MSVVTDDTCPECEGRVRPFNFEAICSECGLVVAEDPIDYGPEWRTFEDDDRNLERTGAPLTRARHDRGLSTQIGYAVELTGNKRRKMARLRKQHNRALISSKRDRNQVQGFIEIEQMVGDLELPEYIHEQACVLFETAQNNNLFQGRSIEGFTAASIYAVCRQRSISRTVEEIAEIAIASRNELSVAYDALNRELGLHTGPIDPREYLPRYASKLDLPMSIERMATELATVANEEGITAGRNPSGVAAACLYTAAKADGHSLTQKSVADVANVSTVTIRKSYKALESLASQSEK